MQLTGLAGARVIVTAGGSGIGKRDRGAVRRGGRLACSPATSTPLSRRRDRGGSAASARASPTSPARPTWTVCSTRRWQRLGGWTCSSTTPASGGPVACVEDVPPAEWRRTLDVNLTGAFLCSRRAAPLLKEQGSGSIITMSSHYGILGGPSRSPYVASKWAIIGFTKTLAMELGPFGIRANAICPGRCGGRATGAGDPARVRRAGHHVRATARGLGHAAPRCARSSTADDVAAMILFLCSDQGARHLGAGDRRGRPHRVHLTAVGSAPAATDAEQGAR